VDVGVTVGSPTKMDSVCTSRQPRSYVFNGYLLRASKNDKLLMDLRGRYAGVDSGVICGSH